MTLSQRINAFAQLGHFLSQFSTQGIERKEGVAHNELFFDGFQHQMKRASEHNGWFTKDTILFALEGWASQLHEQALRDWLEAYVTSPILGAALAKADTLNPKTIAIIMAGNIPLVGFHDFMCVLLAGHRVLVKQSSNDKQLLPFLAKYLEHVAPDFKGYIRFTEEKLANYDAVIATGSNNTARYFDYYFGKKPHIIRKNRNSVAVLTGEETPEELELLSEDIFRYYGLGCRNVSKIFVPKGYNFDAFFQAMYGWKDIIYKAKYANNYDYNKAVYLMSLFDILDNGFFMIKEDQGYASPIATLFYEYYETQEALIEQLERDKEKIQCVVSSGFHSHHIPFGQTQRPGLSDYADGVDTIAFLLKL